METKQEQTSTTGQPRKNFLGTNRSIGKSIDQSTSAEISAHPNSPAGKSTGTIPGLKARYSKGGIMYFPSEPVKRDKERFSFKDCKAWNIYRAECVDVYIMGNIDPDYAGCAVLNIPDNPHPWNTLRSVIEQFYQREKNIAKERICAHEAIEKTQRLEGKNKQLDDARWILDSHIGELKKELAQAHDKIAELESNNPVEIPTRLNLLNDLLQQSDAGEWVDIMGGILDCVIGLSCYESNTVSGSDIYFTRRLQEFFMKLDKAEQTKEIDPASNNI